MFYLLPFGLFQSISNAIATAFKWIFDKVLTPVLKLVIMEVVKPVVELVLKALYDILYPVFLLLLQLMLSLLDIIEQAFNIFSGTAPILVKKSTEADFSNAKREYLMNVIFGQNTVSSAFWYITLIAFILTLGFTMVSVVRSTMDLEGKRPVGKVLGSTGKAMLTFLMVPFVVICTINLSSMVLVKSGEAISLGSGVPNTTIGTHLFLTLSSESYKATDAKTREDIRNFYYDPNDSVRVYTNTEQVEKDFDIKTIKYFSGYIVCIALALMMIMASFLFIVRIFEVVILYIVSPFFVATMPLDDGGRFKSWRDLFIAKLVSGFGMVYAMKIYILLIPVLLGTDVRFFDNVYKNTIMQLVFLVGGSFAVVKSNSLIMQAVNPQAAMAEAASAGSAMSFATGAAMGAGRNAMSLGKSAAGKMSKGAKSMGRGIKKGASGAGSLAKLGMDYKAAKNRGEDMTSDQVMERLPQSWSSLRKGADGVMSFKNLNKSIKSARGKGERVSTADVMASLPKSWSSTKKAQSMYSGGKAMATSYGEFKKSKAAAAAAKKTAGGAAAGKTAGGAAAKQADAAQKPKITVPISSSVTPPSADGMAQPAARGGGEEDD